MANLGVRGGRPIQGGSGSERVQRFIGSGWLMVRDSLSHCGASRMFGYALVPETSISRRDGMRRM